MQSRLFRYRIDRAVRNAVFLATDESTGASVLVYEWTPPAGERGAAKLRLEALANGLAAEVFTADASFYLIAPTQDAAERALSMLQAQDLFSGAWGTASSEPPPPPEIADRYAGPPAAAPAPPLAAPFRPVQDRPVQDVGVPGGLAVGSTTAGTPVPAYPAPGSDRARALRPQGKPFGCLGVLLGLLIVLLAWAATESFQNAEIAAGVYVCFLLVIYILNRRGGR